MQNKNILIITPFFAPETHAAVFRAHKLVKYLKREGWNPIVLTVDTNYVYNEDESLLKDLKEVEIHRTKYIEPSLRGLYMWITGKDRTFKNLKIQGQLIDVSNNKETEVLKKTKISFTQNVYNYFLNNFLNVPDRFWTWEKGAIKKATLLIDEHDIKYVYTTSLPFTTLKIGASLKQKRDIKWIADYRDPIMYSLRNHSSIFKVYKKQKKIEINALEKADVITMLSSAYKLIYHDLYGGKFDHKMVFIPTGIDDDYIPNEVHVSENEILYVGEFLLDYGIVFFKYLEKYLESNPNQIKKIKIRFIGNITINKQVVLSLPISNTIKSIIIFEDHLPQKELYKKIIDAKAVLLIPGHNSHWWTNFAKMVDYIGLQKQVLAIVPNPSEARMELLGANLGMFLDSEEDAFKVFSKIFDTPFVQEPNSEFCNKYLASSQVKGFIEIFESL
jgi:hypothetical protein